MKNKSCLPSAFDLLTGEASMPEVTQKPVAPDRQKAFDEIKDMSKFDLSAGSPIAKATKKLHEDNI